MKNAKENANGIKNKKKTNKKKRDAIKSTVNSPFNLNWPAIDYGVYSGIVSSLGQSFDEYINQIKSEAGSLDIPGTKVKNATKKLLARAEPSCIVFGYNTVMRGLEKNKLKCVLVKAEAMPVFLTKSFIPICKLKSIPLIPIKNLVQNFEREISTKSTLAVGFTDSACKENGPFHDLYKKCCHALGYKDEDSRIEGKTVSEINSVKVKQKKSKKANRARINLYHLKRENKSYRMFKPAKQNDNSLSFIKIGTSDNDTKRSITKSEILKVNNKDERLVTNPTECHFFIDLGSDAEMDEEPEHSVVPPKPICRKLSTARYFGALDGSLNNSDSVKRKKSHYIPTKIKRIKGNPNRHS